MNLSVVVAPTETRCEWVCISVCVCVPHLWVRVKNAVDLRTARNWIRSTFEAFQVLPGSVSTLSRFLGKSITHLTVTYWLISGRPKKNEAAHNKMSVEVDNRSWRRRFLPETKTGSGQVWVWAKWIDNLLGYAIRVLVQVQHLLPAKEDRRRRSADRWRGFSFNCLQQ